MEWWLTWREFGALPFAGDVYDQPLDVYEALWLCSKIAAEEQQAALPDLTND